MSTLADLLRDSLWTIDLTDIQRMRVEREVQVRFFAAGATVVRKGDPVEHWLGIVDGLVKINTFSADGRSTTFTGVPRGGWFGEGSILKNELRKYDVIALRDSHIALMPKATFMWLLDTSIPFNRFLLQQLNERLGQFIATVENDRLLDPDARVARCLAGLFNTVLYPGIGAQLQISQEEIGYLAGVSRQRVNQALKVLEQAGLLHVEYGGLTIKDLEGLRRFGP
ncbi:MULTISPECIES: Crp/Fnr family transcriptional regulator [Niveibacterium]|uniref:Crp/Fnr family transcriptional regulator n=1 Tax=Niveibacterium microcysteis TaxID=2811415 RepID=A0ABX7M5A2_9RHOO|nr:MULTISPECIES: Crp/Fnr family transcriptional regulator [Niveibacterium]QSI76920.1 Crp/Fnr family transcriptional regulator [Niveibacterium microcysteis]